MTIPSSGPPAALTPTPRRAPPAAPDLSALSGTSHDEATAAIAPGLGRARPRGSLGLAGRPLAAHRLVAGRAVLPGATGELFRPIPSPAGRERTVGNVVSGWDHQL